LNTILRKKAKKESSWYLTTHKDDRALSIEDICQMIQEGDARALAQHVSQAGRDLPGSKPFWQKAQRDLIAQIRSPECRSPHVFFTASSNGLICISTCQIMFKDSLKMNTHIKYG
jgi:hypothetical protein